MRLPRKSYNIFGPGEDTKITHQRDKSSSEIEEGGWRAEVEAQSESILLRPPSPHRILAKLFQVLLEELAWGGIVFFGGLPGA